MVITGISKTRNAKAVAFRALVDGMQGTYQDLPAGSFAESGTNVNTCLVRLIKK